MPYVAKKIEPLFLLCTACKSQLFRVVLDYTHKFICADCGTTHEIEYESESSPPSTNDDEVPF